MSEIQDAIEGVGGTTSPSIRPQAFSVRVRYANSTTQCAAALGEIPITSPSGAPIPLAQLSEIRTVEGPTMISSENGLLRGTVLLNVRGRDVGSFVDEARPKLLNQVQMPPGYYMDWSGQYENQQRARQRLMIVVPIVLVIIFGLLYMTYNSVLEAAHVLLAVPFALTGGVYLLWALGYNFSVAVWVGFIALFGTAVQTGVVMVIYLEEAVERKRQEVGVLTRKTLMEAVTEGALLRLRPKVMTVSTVVAGLLPIMWSTSAGSEVMKPLATPVLGGMVSSLLHVLIVTPVIFFWLRERQLKKQGTGTASEEMSEVSYETRGRQQMPITYHRLALKEVVAMSRHSVLRVIIAGFSRSSGSGRCAVLAQSLPSGPESKFTVGASSPMVPGSAVARYADQQAGLTVDQAVAYALEHNGELLAARKDIDAASALVKQASLRANPKLDASVSKMTTGIDNNVTVNGMLPLELGGRSPRADQVAEREPRHARQDVANRERMLAADVR